jgi:hypothetical protein
VHTSGSPQVFELGMLLCVRTLFDFLCERRGYPFFRGTTFRLRNFVMLRNFGNAVTASVLQSVQENEHGRARFVGSLYGEFQFLDEKCLRVALFRATESVRPPLPNLHIPMPLLIGRLWGHVLDSRVF